MRVPPRPHIDEHHREGLREEDHRGKQAGKHDQDHSEQLLLNK